MEKEKDLRGENRDIIKKYNKLLLATGMASDRGAADADTGLSLHADLRHSLGLIIKEDDVGRRKFEGAVAELWMKRQEGVRALGEGSQGGQVPIQIFALVDEVRA